MRRKSERGQGRLSSLLLLVLVAAVVYAGWHVVPVFIDHYSFVDKVVEICRTPRYKGNDDDVYQLLMKDVGERQLDPGSPGNPTSAPPTAAGSSAYVREDPAAVKTFRFLQADSPDHLGLPGGVSRASFSQGAPKILTAQQGSIIRACHVEGMPCDGGPRQASLVRPAGASLGIRPHGTKPSRSCKNPPGARRVFFFRGARGRAK
jgi:hypothetical protein